MSGIRANKTKRLREKLIQYMSIRGPKSSRELLDYYNSVSKQGSTMNSMTNVLAKDPRFRVVGETRVGTIDSKGNSKYTMLVWGLSVNEEE